MNLPIETIMKPDFAFFVSYFVPFVIKILNFTTKDSKESTKENTKGFLINRFLINY